MSRAPRALAALVLLFAAGCSLPARDNPFDDANRPSAAISIASAPWDGEQCGTFEDSTVFSHGACVRISAAGSTDPQGGALDYRFDAAASCDEECAGAACWTTAFTTSTSGEFTPIDVALDPQAAELPLQGQRCVRVQVRDPDGHRSTATEPIVLTNARPRAIVPGIVLAPATGAPWSPGSPLEVRVSAGSSEDDDGNDDIAAYCWSLIADDYDLLDDANPFTPVLDEVPKCVSHPQLTTRLKAGVGGVVRLELFVRDRLGEESSPVPVVVQAGYVPTWAEDLEGLNAIALDVDRRVFSVGSSLVGTPSIEFAPDPADARIFLAVTDGPDFDLVAADMDGATPPLVVSLPSGHTPLATVLDDARDLLWVLLMDEQTNALLVQAYDDTSLALLDSAMPAGGDPFGDEVHTVLESDGTLWMVALFGRTAYRVHFDGGIVEEPPVDAEPERSISGIGIRPLDDGQEEAWILQISDFLGGVPLDEAFIAIYGGDGSATETGRAWLEDEGLGGAFGLVFVDEQTAWITFATDDAIDASALSVFAVPADEEGDYHLFTRTRTPIPLGVDFLVDSRVGWYIVVDFSRTSGVVVSLDGSKITLTGTDEIEAVAGPDGPFFWVVLSPPTAGVGGGERIAIRGRGSLRSPFILQAVRPIATGRLTPDFATGDAWGPGFLPRGAFRMTVNGRLADLIGKWDDPPSILGLRDEPARPLPFPAEVLPDPASGSIWITEATNEFGLARALYRLDPNGVRPDSLAAPWAGFRPPLELSARERVAFGAAVEPIEGSLLAALLVRRLSPSDAGHDCDTRAAALATPSHCWYVQRFPATGRLPDGGLPPPLFLGSAGGPGFAFDEDVPRLARDILDGGVCVATMSEKVLRVARLRYVNGIDQLPAEEWGAGVVVSTDAIYVQAVAAYAQACWVAYLEGSTHRIAHVSGPSDVLSAPSPAETTSFSPDFTGSGVLWAGRDGTFQAIQATGGNLVFVGQRVTLPEPVVLRAP